MSFSLNPFTGKLDKIKKAVWGTITGTLSDQTDLQSALDTKANDSGVVHTTGTESIAGAKTFTGNADDVPVTITNTGTGYSFVINDEAGDASPFIVSASGNVGIGVSSPAYPLHVGGAAATAVFVMENNTYIGAKTAAGLVRRIFSMNLSNQIVIGAIDGTGAAMYFRTSSGQPMYFQDSTQTNMTIAGDGKVGIGDTNPDNLLDVHSATEESAIAITSLGTNTDALIKFELADNTPTFTMGVDDSDSDKFKISTTALGTNDRFVIDSTGNVGIGTASPGQKLDVAGTIQCDALRVDATPDVSVSTPSTHKLAINLNGTVYYLLLSNV